MSDVSMQQALIEKMLAWQSALFFSQYPSHSNDAAQLVELIGFLASQQSEPVASQIAVAAKQGLKESRLDFLQDQHEAVQRLKSYLASAVEMAAWEMNSDYWPEDAQVNVDITESWYHLTQDGGYHDVHSHPNCSWCGIYYLEAGDSTAENASGVNRFYEPRANANHYLDAGNQYLDQESYWDVTPRSGDLVIFPSYLKHSAMPYFGSKDRIVVAFNAQLHFKEQ